MGDRWETRGRERWTRDPGLWIRASGAYLWAMPILETAYAVALRAARPLLPLLARGEGKLARGIRGRRDVLERLEDWSAGGRREGAQLAWFHAPSVGEGLQARAVIEALRERAPEVQVAYTYFSPSAERFAGTVPADWTGYLPLDLPGEMRRALDLLRPSVIAFTKTEVWPVLTREALARGVRLALLSATLPPGSSRLSARSRALLAPAHERLHHVAAISAEDSGRFSKLGVPAPRRSVMGDARCDQVWSRAAGVDRASPLLAPLLRPGPPTLVAGSTWPPDEDRLLPAVRAVRDAGTPLRLVLAPHEPTPEHLSRTATALQVHGLPHLRLGEVEAGAEPREVVLVDRVGVLGELYAAADLAYVGGGFGTAGLHSVLEPAAFGAPVVFGPNHGNAREAAELVAAGGGFTAEGADELRRVLSALTSDAPARERAGASARSYVRAGRGAAARGAEIVLELLRAGG